MSITTRDVRYIAELARLSFTAEEEERLARELNDVLSYMEKLNELDTSAVPPMSHVLDLYNVFREDDVRHRVEREQALQSGPDADDAYFRVPKIIE